MGSQERSEVLEQLEVHVEVDDQDMDFHQITVAYDANTTVAGLKQKILEKSYLARQIRDKGLDLYMSLSGWSDSPKFTTNSCPFDDDSEIVRPKIAYMEKQFCMIEISVTLGGAINGASQDC